MSDLVVAGGVRTEYGIKHIHRRATDRDGYRTIYQQAYRSLRFPRTWALDDRGGALRSDLGKETLTRAAP